MSSKNKKTTKTGLRVLTYNDDLVELFTGEKSNNKTESDFTAMLEESLSNKNLEKALEEKNTCSYHSKKSTIQDTLKDYPMPQDEIDLHGCTKHEAQEKISCFIKYAVNKKLKTIRIISGKGLHSEKAPVLPDIAEEEIVELKKRKIVLTFKWEKQLKRTSGSLLVYLP